MRKYLSAFVIIIIGIGILGVVNVFGTGDAVIAIPSISSEKAKEIKTEFQKIMPNIKDITKINMPPIESSQNIEESLFINPDGNTKITKGAVIAINPDGKILDVKIWGLIVRVDISETMMLSGKCPLAEYQCPPMPPCQEGLSCPQVMPPCPPPPKCQIEIEKFNVGDFVNLAGWMADKNSTPPIVKAKYIKNISGAQLEIQKIKDQIEQLLKRLRELQQQLGITQTPKACPMKAKICPDGTSVGPTGPNCEFVCPTTVGCPADVKICPDGTSISRTSPDCGFAPCDPITTNDQ